jgi:hypothetical protein
MDDSLPTPTRDPIRMRHDLDEFGFALVADALSPTQTAALRARLIEQAQAEAKIARAIYDGGPGTPNQRVFNLINKGQVFRDLTLHPLIDDVMTHLLGSEFILSSLTANIAGFGGEAMVLHRDQGYIAFHTPVPVVANIAWMLDDVSEANGGTRVLPGSHLLPEPLSDPLDMSRTVAAEGPAGTALVFDGRLYHGTGRNTTHSKRHLVLSYFCRFFIRQQENMFLSLDPAVESSLSERLKVRLGYKVCGTLGGVEVPIEGSIVSRPAQTIGQIPNR